MRAYVVLSHGEILGLDDDGPLKVKLTFRNCGTTPALNSEGGADVTDDGTVPNVKHEEIFGRKFTVGAGDETYMFQELDVTLRNDIKDGKVVIRAAGLIRYDDIFGVPHRTQFSLDYKGEPATDASPYMAATEFGNEIN